MEALIPQLAQLLNNTLSPDNDLVSSATEALDRLSLLPQFPFALLSLSAGGENQGQKIAAAAYLKNFTRRHSDEADKISVEFRNQLVHASLLAEPAVLKLLVEAFRTIIVKQLVKENSWPELVPELRSVIENSNLISGKPDAQWKTINALTVLQSVLRPFQYFLNPSLKKEPVPPQLEFIAREILVPLLLVFHNLVEKVLSIGGRTEVDLEKVLLLVCKCIYFSVRSHMPPALSPALPSFCQDLFRILNSLRFDGTTLEDDYMIRVKTGKRSLLIFCALVTRHRKHSDKLMPNIVNCASKIVKQSTNISKLNFLSERVLSLSFDVISHILETGPGWRLVSPHFSSLMDSAIFPALVMNDKDISEWEEDPDEYMRKNLPSDLDEISGWREDLFTARKSAINLLGVISMSKGPPMSFNNNAPSSVKRKKGEKSKGKELRNSMGELLVLPFLSKFPFPSDAAAGQFDLSKDYYGVLMAYGGLQDFLSEWNPGYTSTLVRTRMLPLYSMSKCVPYLLAAANWVIGELASSLPEEITDDIYSSLLKALVLPDAGDISCYPVRASAAGAIAELIENEYFPSEWLPLLQVVVSKIDNDDDNESSILFQLLTTIVEAGNDNVVVHIPYIVSTMVGVISKHIPPIPEPWPQAIAKKNRENRAKQIAKHTTGRISFPQLRERITVEEGGPPSQGEFFKKTHISPRTHGLIDELSREYIDKMNDLAGRDENGVQQPVTDEIYTQVMPAERNGRVRLMGLGVTPTNYFDSRTISHGGSVNRISELEAEIAEMRREAEEKESERNCELEDMKKQALEKEEEARRKIDEMKMQFESQLESQYETIEARLLQKMLDINANNHRGSRYGRRG